MERKAIIFDMDGTLYLGDQLMKGADSAIAWARRTGWAIRFLTNNPRHSREHYARKLRKLGVAARSREVITSVEITLSMLSRLDIDPPTNVLVVGEQRLRRALARAGYHLTDDPVSAQAVLVSFDTTVDYERLQKAFLALRQGARFLATNPDVVCPTAEGGLLDAGSLLSALTAASGRRVEAVAGKPSKYAAHYLFQDLGVPAFACVMVGDRAETDVRFGKRHRMYTVLVSTGATGTRALPRRMQPSARIATLVELPDLLADWQVRGR